MTNQVKGFAAALLSVGCLVMTATSAFAEKRLALVIGNSAYEHTTVLANPTNDAGAMSQRFRELGFSVIEGYNLDKPGMDAALRDFARQSRESDLNVFFYAGHGMSVGGQNYLVPVDAAFSDPTALDFEAVNVDFVTKQMSYSDSVNLVFLDACRDNPLSKSLARSMGATRSAGIRQGLAEMRIPDAGKGMAIAFATSPGEVAQDGAGRNSPFTTALLNHISAENTDIAEVFSRVTGEVYSSTGQTQRPWLNVSLTGPVVLNPVEAKPVQQASLTPAPSVPAADRMADLEGQKMLFELARSSGKQADYQSYLDIFPNGIFAENARREVEALTTARGINTGAASVSATAAAPVLKTYGSTDSPNVGQQHAVVSAASINEVGPLVLTPTAATRMAYANEGTEAALDLDRTAKGNIQARLNATGNNVGGVDGKWGSKTRQGIRNWQSQNGFTPSGYLNQPQLQMLMVQTEGRYTPYTAPVATARKTTSGRSSTSSRKSSNDELVKNVIIGIGAAAAFKALTK